MVYVGLEEDSQWKIKILCPHLAFVHDAEVLENKYKNKVHAFLIRQRLSANFDLALACHW